jgi:hypothetical protein
MAVYICRADSHELLKSYIKLPKKIYRQYANYVSPLFRDEYNFHDPKRNHFLAESVYVRFLAYKDGEPAGRIMGIVLPDKKKEKDEISARFYQFDSINDNTVAAALITEIKKWARIQGATTIIGPFGFSDKDPQGLQIEGFGFAPAISTASHPPYLPLLLENNGFEKFKDCISYRFELNKTLPSLYQIITDRVLKNNHLRLVEFSSKKSIKPYFHLLMEIMNEAYANIYGYIRMNREDIDRMADQFLLFINPKLVKIVCNKYGTPVAFVIAMANLSKGFRKADGNLFPIGFLHILKDFYTSKTISLLCH